MRASSGSSASRSAIAAIQRSAGTPVAVGRLARPPPAPRRSCASPARSRRGGGRGGAVVVVGNGRIGQAEGGGVLASHIASAAASGMRRSTASCRPRAQSSASSVPLAATRRRRGRRREAVALMSELQSVDEKECAAWASEPDAGRGTDMAPSCRQSGHGKARATGGRRAGRLAVWVRQSGSGGGGAIAPLSVRQSMRLCIRAGAAKPPRHAVMPSRRPAVTGPDPGLGPAQLRGGKDARRQPRVAEADLDLDEAVAAGGASRPPASRRRGRTGRCAISSPSPRRASSRQAASAAGRSWTPSAARASADGTMRTGAWTWNMGTSSMNTRRIRPSGRSPGAG